MPPAEAPPRPAAADDGLGEPDPIDPAASPPVEPVEEQSQNGDGPPPDADLGDEGEGKQDEPEALSMAGDYEQMSLNVGGKKPTSSVFKVQGGKIDLEGEFRKGDIVRVEMTLRVGEVAVADKVDSTGNVASTTRTHKGRVEGVRRIIED